MRKKFCLIAALVLSAFLLACNSGDGPKIGVVDINRLMRDSVPGKAGLKFIETQQTELQGRLDAIQDKLEKNPTDEAAMQELQKVYAAAQQKIQAEGQNVVGQLFDAIQGALNNYREKNGYSALLRMEALDSYDPSLDVTSAVMAEVNRIEIKFKPVAAPEKMENAAKAPAEKPANQLGEKSGDGTKEKPAEPQADRPAEQPKE